MDYAERLRDFAPAPDAAQVAELVAQARHDAPKNQRREVYERCLSCIDLTSLNPTDSDEQITAFAQKAVEFPLHFPSLPNVASICVYPNFVETVGLVLGESSLAITSVAGGFPASQTFLEVKALECAMAVENGADEIDIVISIGQALTGHYNRLACEIETLRAEVGEATLLKVIIESGALTTPQLIHHAALLAMLAGADFVKTSTGKIPVAATPEAAVVICLAIREFQRKTGRTIGFKAAGGIATAADAALYHTIVQQTLGPTALTPARFRIGASSLANNLLSAITDSDIHYF